MWGCFVGNKLGPLVCFPKGKIVSKEYYNLLNISLLSLLNTLDNKEDAIYIEDNAPIHKSRYTAAWKQDHDIDTMRWPVQSPDLNPIENLWYQLKLELDKTKSKNITQLLVLMQDVWNGFRQTNRLNTLVESMSRRIHEVISTKGLPINY